MNSRQRLDLNIRVPQLRTEIANLQLQLDNICSQLQGLPEFQHDRIQDDETSGSAPENDNKTAIIEQAQNLVFKHLSDVKKYNEVKDAATKLLEVVAQQKGVRMKDVLEERGIKDET